MTLLDSIQEYELDIPTQRLEMVDQYCQRLWSANESLNLTRHTDYDKFVARDLVDTWELSKLIDDGQEVFDIGTGGGVPGVLLAILRPDLTVSVCDSVKKKAAAVEDIVQQLGLPVPVYAERAEQVLDDFRYDTSIARAVGPLWKICAMLRNHWDTAATKGPRWQPERDEAKERGYLSQLELQTVAQYTTPGTLATNVILELRAKTAPH